MCASAGESVPPGRPSPPSSAEPTAAQARGRATLPRAHRLRKRADFLRVQSRGRKVHAPHFILLVLPGETQALGVTVTRKVAGAVGRNRIKRLCREVFRLNRELFPAACTVVVVARAGADKLDYAAVRAEVAQASAALQRLAHAFTADKRPSFPGQGT